VFLVLNFNAHSGCAINPPYYYVDKLSYNVVMKIAIKKELKTSEISILLRDVVILQLLDFN
jgi:hypothetical protein